MVTHGVVRAALCDNRTMRRADSRRKRQPAQALVRKSSRNRIMGPLGPEPGQGTRSLELALFLVGKPTPPTGISDGTKKVIKTLFAERPDSLPKTSTSQSSVS